MGEINEVKELLERALETGMSGAEHCAKLPIEALAENYNGVGPAWASDWVRSILTKCHRTFLSAVLIHDMRYTESDGTTHGFNFANDELETNCLIAADAAYCIINPLRYVARYRAVKIAGACRILGWPAWMDGCKKRMEKRK